MKILNPQSATLSNYEVYAHITSRRAASLIPSSEKRQARDRARERERPQQRKLKAPNYEAVSREILEYLSPGSTSNSKDKEPLPSTSATSTTADTEKPTSPLPAYAVSSAYSASNVASLLHELAPYNLAKAELLMIVNLRPGDAASLDAVVEEVDDRFDEVAQREILEIVKRWIG